MRKLIQTRSRWLLIHLQGGNQLEKSIYPSRQFMALASRDFNFMLPTSYFLAFSFTFERK